MNAGMFAIKRFKANLHGRSTGTTDTENCSSASQVTPATLQAAWREFESEIEILNRFSGDVHPHLISLQAAFRHGDDHCVIFPWAEYDLKTLWKTKSFEPPLHKSNLECKQQSELFHTLSGCLGSLLCSRDMTCSRFAPDTIQIGRK